MGDIKDMTDEEIFNRLREIGIEIDIDNFKSDALKAGTPSALSDSWASTYNISIHEPALDFLYDAALELWKRHLGHIKCPEVIADFIDEVITDYEDIEKQNRDSLLKTYERIERFCHYLLKEDSSPDIDIYRDLEEYSFYNIEGFLNDMSFELAEYGLVDEAVNIARWFSPFSEEPEAFLKCVVSILAKAGRKEEAIKQIEENLEMFPCDTWVVINAADAMNRLGDKNRAEELYLKAYDIADEYNMEDVLERLIDFYNENSLTKKAGKFEAEYKALIAPPQPQVVKAKKIGRNELCPCGSGKKYKKCCLNKTAN